MRPAQASVHVPSTQREVARLCGAAVAERMSEMSVEDVAEHSGAESARLYRIKLEGERRETRDERRETRGERRRGRLENER
jgi:hypothetical protein